MRVSSPLSPIYVMTMARSNPNQSFTYSETHGNIFGPADWGRLRCESSNSSCPMYPDPWEWMDPRIAPKWNRNSCVNCRRSTPLCREQKQSPIALLRNVTQIRRCKDRHKMSFFSGNSTNVTDLSFTIERHSLRTYQPLDWDGNSIYQYAANIDFSMGFPDPWHLLFTDVKVPSEHTQDGKRYDAEIVLVHEYSNKEQNEKLIGNVAIFLESGNSSDHYDFLDLYIQKWMEEERRILDHCHVQRNATTNTRVFRRKFTPYDWLKRVATEYYFRYEGSQTVPPCFSQAVHWRVMKDSIRVAPQQIQQLEQLIARRMNPSTCRLDTAGAIRAGYHGKNLKLVDVNRPLQITYPAHKAVFCECSNWESKIEKDRLWCKLPREERGVLPHWKDVRRQ